MAFDFTGKKILVTGAGRGIGRGIAVSLARAGCKVYALDNNKETLDSLAAEKLDIVALHQDLRNWEETRATLQTIEVLDGLVNNAGILLPGGSCLDQTKEDLDKCLQVNLLAYINCIQVVAQKMRESGRKGSIVNIASTCSQKAIPGLLAYNVAKAGVDMVTKQYALELGPYNIRVNSVNPTMVETDIFQSIPQAHVIKGFILERTPLGRVAKVEDIVGPVLYLLSDVASMVTGTTNPIDGGIFCNITTKQ